MSKTVLKLIYFSGCPRIEEARALLKKAGADFVEIRQEALPAGHPLTAFSSPTALAGDQLIFGAKIGEGSSACSISLPGLDEVQRRLAEINR